MRKLFYVIVLLLGASFVLSSCEKTENNDSPESSIVGTWDCIEQVVVLEDGTSITYSDKRDWLDDENYIVLDYSIRFESDGLADSKVSYQDDFEGYGRYSIKDGILYVKGIPMCSMKVEGDRMVLSAKEGDGAQIAANIAYGMMGRKLVKGVVATYVRE